MTNHWKGFSGALLVILGMLLLNYGIGIKNLGWSDIIAIILLNIGMIQAWNADK
jgi:hypothetical protein